MRPSRHARRGTAGQVLVIFGVFGLVLFGVVGLAIDSGRGYTVAAHELQAAKAGALAGVPYMPGDLTTARYAAQVEAARNGYHDGDNTSGRHVVVTVTQPAGTSNQLQVTVSDTIGVSLMSLFGFGNFTVTRNATAYYLPPLSLGQPNGQMGADLASLGSANNYYFMRTEGWSNPRHEGDAFTPTPNDTATACDAGGGASCVAAPRDEHVISSDRGTDLSSVGGVALPARGGYNYLIFVAVNKTVDLQVFNPAFAPDDSTGGYDFHEYDGSFSPGSTTATDYSAMMYTVLKVSQLFSRLSDTLVSSQTYLPYDATSSNSCGGSTGPSRYCWFDNTGTEKGPVKCQPFDYHVWVDVLHSASGACTANLVAAGGHPTAAATHLDGGTTGAGKYYRLRVDTMDFKGGVPDYSTDGNGSYAHKGYAVRLVDVGKTTLSCGTCTLSAMTDMALFTPITATGSTASFTVPLFAVPKEYKGQTLAVYIFDPGDVSGGDAYMKILRPAYTNTSNNPVAQGVADLATSGLNDLGTSIASGTSTPITPTTAGKAYLQTASGSGGGVIYNGVWLQFLISIPSDYNPATAPYWNLEYDVAGSGSAGDTISVQVSLTGGSPVHLLP